MTQIALFPLSTVLLPFGRVPLQIFERRYVDLVAKSMRDEEGFGIVWLRRGSEVLVGDLSTSDLSSYGTYARIVDWDQLANGLLGIVVEGEKCFDIESTWRDSSGLVTAEVNLFEQSSKVQLDAKNQSLVDILRDLLKHPQVKRLGFETDFTDAWRVVMQLAQILPVKESTKYELLRSRSVEFCVEKLEIILGQMSGD